MENEKKKRKNKKKKNKQVKTSEDETVLSESTSVEDNHMRNGQNDHNLISDTVDHSHQRTGGTKDAKLEDTIKQLHEETSFHKQKGAALESKLVELEGEKHSWLIKEVELVDNIRKFQEDKIALDLEGARLLHTIEQLERDKYSLILKENSCRAEIADKNNDISRLQAQVMELEEQRDDLLRENKLLMENVTDYQSKVLTLERRMPSAHSSDQITKEMLSSQVDAARILVDKLITENAELIGKVNELFVELQRVGKTAPSSAMKPGEEGFGTTLDDPETPLIPSTGNGLEALEAFPIYNHSIGSNIVDLDNDLLSPISPVPIDEGEIVQIPLHENEDRERERELAVADGDEKDVLLSDAPLIGAPYRLISFMANYVSGADLVGKS